MLPRTLEPEVMDTREEAVDYDAMDHSTVNAVFVDDFLAVANSSELGSRLRGGGESVRILDVGTGTAQIPIALCHRLSTGESGRDGTQRPVRITAIDLAAEMLALAERNVVAAGFEESIIPQRIDAKALPYPAGSFDVVFSNSIVHHIPQPQAAMAEMVRVSRPGGVLFVRDLLRPQDAETVESLVSTYAGNENAHQQQMFRESLHAALTLPEVCKILVSLGISADCAEQTTDRHWTITATA